MISCHLSDADRVVGQDVVDGQLRESGHAHGGAHVVGEDQEGGARAAVEAEVRDAVKDGPHGVLADAVVEVAAGVAASCIQGRQARKTRSTRGDKR